MNRIAGTLGRVTVKESFPKNGTKSTMKRSLVSFQLQKLRSNGTNGSLMMMMMMMPNGDSPRIDGYCCSPWLRWEAEPAGFVA